MTRKLVSNNELTKQLNEKLESFVKQAKESYLKYDKYLDNAEELLNYTIDISSNSFDVIEAIFSNAIMSAEFDFATAFAKEKSAEVEVKIKKILEKFSKSELLKRKKLFLDIQKRFSFKEKFNLREIQQKYDKFLGQTKQAANSNRSQNAQLRQIFLNDVYSFIAEPGNTSQGDTASPVRSMNAKDLEQFIYQHLVGFVQAAINTKNLLESHPTFVVDPGVLKEVIAKVTELFDTLKGHVVKFRNSLTSEINRDSEPECSGNDPDPSELNGDIQRLHQKISEIERLEYARLLELREENNRLMIVRNHVKGLTVENQKIQEKIRKNEFNLIELDSIIAAYEKNIKEKEIINAEKEQRVQVARQQSQRMNQRIADLLKQILGGLTRGRGGYNDL